MTDIDYRASAPAAMLRIRHGHAAADTREVPEEAPVAIVHDASTYAVMMATPRDLEDLAIGLSLTEGVIADVSETRGVEIVQGELGFEARLWLEPGRAAALVARRRTMAGPTGCGLCGIESLEQMRTAAARPPAALAPLTIAQVQAAMASLEPAQALGRVTRAVHAAGFWTPAEGLVLAREDVGRHNALDKVIGAMTLRGIAPAGVLVLTSRVSVELVQKAAAIGAPVIAAVSAPTALAIRTAEAARITLIAVARPDGFEVFTHPSRIVH
ncbi:MAG TPA: formate dehydrogenase accessory sulfurtransferase FdhD [Caulobacteraceae bacterium]|jgi:FdhD protein|nr:formate dehydrogenase accessory sulfurtransferase FdhD [Caulobacteraceae bacterium]